MQKLTLLEKAYADLEESADWYDDKEPGLGQEFRGAIHWTLRRIQDNPELFSVAKRKVRKCVVRRFPFTVFFVISGTQIMVLRILHASRKPPTW